MPIGNGDRRYSPSESVTAVTDGTCSAGLVAVTVTPGRIAPVLSVTWPMMPAGFDAPWPAVAIVAAESSSMTINKTMNAADPARDLRFGDDIWPPRVCSFRPGPFMLTGNATPVRAALSFDEGTI